MSEKEMFDYLKPYEESLRVEFWSTGTNSEGETEYQFVDDLNISITINPTQKTFMFDYMADKVFRLSSGRIIRFNDTARFENIYYRFRDTVLKLKRN